MIKEKQHLRESYVPPIGYKYETIKLSQPLQESYDKNTEEINAKLKESINQIETLRENFPNKQLFDTCVKRLKESSQDAIKTYRFPIGRYGNLNNNKRIYTRKLWENVINNQRDSWQNLAGLADHPKNDDDPGEWKYSAIVWLDMQIGDDGIVYGIGRFVGPYGALAQDIINAGGRIGFSSSGFGDVDPDTHVVDPDSYIIERTADIVLNPSQSIFGTATNETDKANIEYNTKHAIHEQTKIKEAAAKSAILNNRRNTMTVDAVNTNAAADNAAQVTDTKLNESTKNDNLQKAMSKVEEKSFRKYVTAFMNEAENITNPAERLKEMATILATFEDGIAPDLKELFESRLIEEREKLEKLIESASELQQTFEMDDLTQLQENALKIAEQGVLYKENTEDYKKLVEGLTIRNRQLVKENHILLTKLSLREKRMERAEQVKNEVRVSASTEKEYLKEQIDKINERVALTKQQVSKLSEANQQLEKENGLLKSKMNEMQKKVRVRENTLKNDMESNEKLLEAVKTLKENEKILEGRINRLQQKNITLQESYTTLQNEYKSYKTKIKEENDMSLHIEPKFEKRVSGMLNFRENAGIEIESYWNDLYKRYGESVIPYEKYIRGAKTLREASSYFLKYRNEIDPDFNAADAARVFEGSSMREKEKILRESGMEMLSTGTRSINEVQEDFLENMKKWGFK
jgi:hypothetical protein